MSRQLTFVTAKLPPPLPRLDLRGFVWAKYWEGAADSLKRLVVHPAETAILGLSQFNRPPEKNKRKPKFSTVEFAEVFNVGSIKVEIITTPAKPPVAYEAVYSKFTNFVNALFDQHNRKGRSRARRDDVRKIKGESYVEISVVKDMLAAYLKEIKVYGIS